MLLKNQMISIVIFLLLLVSPSGVMAATEAVPAYRQPDTYRFIYDLKGQGSMESGVSLAWNSSLLLYRGSDYLAAEAGLHDHWYSRPFFLPIVSLAIPNPKQFLHEYYGHGSVLREFGFSDVIYKWGWFDMFPTDGLADSQRVQNEGTYEEQQLWLGGGVAASQLYLLEAEKDMYRKGRGTLLMFLPMQAAMSDMSYLKDGLNADALFESNDGASWLANFKGQHNNDQSLTAKFADRSRNAINAAAFNPVIPWLAVAWLRYLWTGDDSFYAPMLPLAGLKFGFSPKVNLTPLGPENYYYIFIAREGRLASLYYRTGTSPEGAVQGYGAEFGPINIAGLALTPGYDQWTLPAAKSAGFRFSRSGYNAQLKLDAPLYKTLGLTAKAAYKTDGYMLGLPAHSGFHGYAGISLSF